MELSLTGNIFDSTPYWIHPITKYERPKQTSIDLFDTNGYNLTELEQDYAEVNTAASSWRDKKALKQDWFISTQVTEGVHINHAALFERKGYEGLALEQLSRWASETPLFYKLAKIKSKWGIDFALDYTGKDGVVFEVFHYEWDHFDYFKVNEMRKRVQNVVLSIDWDDAAKSLWNRREDWMNLPFFEQSDWKCAYFGLEPEKFKDIIWNDKIN